MEIVKFRNVSEKYRIKFIREGKESCEDFWALKDVTFSVNKGQTLAVIGENGAGKSTILKLIAGLLKPDKGEVLVRGRVSALLELGAGFYPEYTGRENLYLNASLFGITKSDTDSMFNEIVEFSGLGKFIDAQVKSYSQGMFVRLAFSVAIHMNPEILLIDDSLSVGDEDFQKKCIQKILELKKEGKTIIFVTHDLNMARRLCEKGIFLRTGEIIKNDSIESVIAYYMETLGNKSGIAILRGSYLGAVFNNGRLIVRWKDRAITQDRGGYASFSFSGHRFNSPTADWSLVKVDDRQIIAEGKWFNIPVVQTWNIRLCDDGSLDLKVSVALHDKQKLENFQVELLFSEKYKYWVSSRREGLFPKDFFHDRECELIYNDPLDKLACLKESDEDERKDQLPVVIIDAYGAQPESLCEILNSGLDVTARIIRLKPPVLYEPGKNTLDQVASLNTKIKFIESDDPDELEDYLYNARRLMDLEKQKIEKQKTEFQLKRFTFGDGRFSLSIDENNYLHLFCGQMKLTSDPGIITSLLVCKEWKDTCAKQIWMEKIAENHVQVHNLSWNDVPASQAWSFLMKEEGVIEVSMSIDAHTQISIHEINVGIFFSREYAKWRTPHESGNFNGAFEAKEEIYLKDKSVRAVGVTSASMPAVVFDISTDQKYFLRIWNSERPFLCPLVLAATDALECQKGEIEFLKGIIRVTDDLNGFAQESRASFDQIDLSEEDVFDKKDAADQSLYLLDDSRMNEDHSKSSEDSRNKLDEMRLMYQEAKAAIAVTRFNFFKLDKIVRYYADIFNLKLDPDICEFPLFPVKTIFSNSMRYFKQIKAAADKVGLRLVLKDKDLPDILRTISQQATAYNGKQLLRLLGVICEHPFIGPRQIIIDLYHGCNSGCVHCWFHNPKTTYSKEYLEMQFDLDLYKKLVDDARELSVALIVFDGNGEPLLDKRFPRMARYAKDKGIMVSFSTNGLLLDQDMSRRVLSDLYVETICCSLPAATEQTYALINPKQPKSAFQEIVSNLSNFIKLRNSSSGTKTFLQMNHVIHALNCHELMKMAEIDAQIGADIVQFCVMQSPDESMLDLRLSAGQIDLIKDTLAKIKDSLSEKNIMLDDTFISELDYHQSQAQEPCERVWKSGKCPIGWFQTLVSADSQVSMCQLKVIDNLKNASLKEIWNSKKYHSYRIQAKYLKDNKDVIFANGAKLYDENCNSCQIVARILKNDNFSNYGLEKFV